MVRVDRLSAHPIGQSEGIAGFVVPTLAEKGEAQEA